MINDGGFKILKDHSEYEYGPSRGNMYLIQRVNTRNTQYYINLFVKTNLNRLPGYDNTGLWIGKR